MTDKPADQTSEFETDEHGDTVMRPLLGWSMAPTPVGSLLVRLRYAQTEAAAADGEALQLQVHLPAQAALYLSAELARQARSILVLS